MIVEIRTEETEYVGRKAWISLVSDITERKRAEDALAQRNRFIEAILDHLPIGLAVNTVKDGLAQYINPKFEEVYGWPSEVLTDVNTFFEKVYPDPDYREEIKKRIFEDMASGDPSRMQWENIKITGQRGEQKVISVVNIPLFEQDLMISTVQDVTERQRALDALQESEKSYRSIFNDSPIPLCEQDFSEVKTYFDRLKQKGTTDFRGYFENNPQEMAHYASLAKINSVNKAALDLFNAGSVEELRLEMAGLFTEKTYRVFMEEHTAIAAGETSFESEVELLTLAGDAVQTILKWTVLPGYEETLGRVLVSITDITELKSMQKMVIATEKLAGIGTLAGGIAHEINTPLQVITGLSERLMRHIRKKSWTWDACRSILRPSIRAPGALQKSSALCLSTGMHPWMRQRRATWLKSSIKPCC